MQGVAELVERQRLHVELDIGPVTSGIGAGENAELRGRHGQGTTAAKGVIEAHQAASQVGVIGLVERAHAGDLVDRTLLQMVLQVSPDTRPVDDAFNAERGQPFRRPDAGPMKHLCRPDRAGAQDHFAFGAGLENFSIPGEQNARGAAILDDEAVDQHVLLKPQIGAPQDGFEETAR